MLEVDLDAAWKNVLREAHADQIPDVLRFEDHKLAWNTWKAEIAKGFEEGTYTPAPSRLIEMPKDGFLVRPLCLMQPRDRVAYRAIVDAIAPAMDDALPDTVFSYRLKHAKRRLTKQVSAWTRFQDAGRRLYDEYDYAYLLSTDVASYFEYVDTDILCDDLRALSDVDEPRIQSLKRFLMRLTENTPFWGLPQGHDASAFLGNFFLLPLDQALRHHDVKAIRYQDDIKIFADNPTTLRITLREIDQVLRARHLNLSVAKTKMLEGIEVLAEFEDTRKDAIQYGIRADVVPGSVEVRRWSPT